MHGVYVVQREAGSLVSDEVGRGAVEAGGEVEGAEAVLGKSRLY